MYLRHLTHTRSTQNSHINYSKLDRLILMKVRYRELLCWRKDRKKKCRNLDKQKITYQSLTSSRYVSLIQQLKTPIDQM